MRPETEWVKTLEAGWNILLDIKDKDLIEKIQNFNPESQRPDLYGKYVAKNMVKEIEKFVNS